MQEIAVVCMTLLLRLFQKCEILLRGHLAQTSPLKTIFLFVVSFFFWQLLNKITSNKTGNLKTFVISRQKRGTYVQKVSETLLYTYWPRTFDWQNETLCPKALWVGGNTQIWGLFCGFVESVGCVPMLFWFLLCKEFHPFVSIKKRTVFGFFF